MQTNKKTPTFAAEKNMYQPATTYDPYAISHLTLDANAPLPPEQEVSYTVFDKVAFQIFVHGHLGKMMSRMSSGTYGQGVWSEAAGSLVATGAYTYSQHIKGGGYTIGYAYALGVDAMPVNIGFQLNKGGTVEFIQELTPAFRKAFRSW